MTADDGHPLPMVWREELVRRVLSRRVTAIEAGTGWGKTVLLQQVRDTTDRLSVLLTCQPGWQLDDLARAVGEELRRSGQRRAGATVALLFESRGLASGLARLDEPVLLLLDEVEHLHPATVEALAHVVRDAEDTSFVLAGRRLGEQLRSLLPPGWSLVDHDALMATTDEVVSLLSGDDAAARARAVVAATGGWFAAIAQALQGGVPVAATTEPEAWIEEVLEHVSPDREGLSWLASLPLVDATIVAALELDGAMSRARTVGVPLRRLASGWEAVASPFRDVLRVEVAALPPTVVEVAALTYLRQGEVFTAIDLLRRADRLDDIARLLAEVPEGALLSGPLDLLGLVEQLRDEPLREHPDVLLAASHLCMFLGLTDQRDAVTSRLLRLAEGEWRPVAVAERAHDLVWRGGHGEARALLDELGEDDLADTRVLARQQEVVARTRWLDDEGERREDVLGAFARAKSAWLALDQPELAAWVELWTSVIAHWNLGAFDRATDGLRQALTLAGGSILVEAVALPFLLMVQVEVGEYDEVVAELPRAQTITRRTSTDSRAAYLAWAQARMASQQGESDVLLAAIERAEGFGLRDSGSGAFAADVAQLLDRVGHERAQDYLAAAVRLDDGRTSFVPVAQLAMAARAGDWATADAVWQDAFGGDGVSGTREPSHLRDRWRLHLLLAHAAGSVGEESIAAGHAVAAFDDAASLGRPRLPFVREPALAGDLVVLAAGHGSASARKLLSDGIVTVHVMGNTRVLDLRQRDVTPVGAQLRLLEYVIAMGGRVRADVAAAELHDDVPLERARQRLRTSLSRLRRDAGDLLRRDGEDVLLSPGVVSDLARFDDAAARARRSGDLAHVERAVALHGGRPFVHDEPWSEPVRERVRSTVLRLLDDLVADLVDRGDLERAGQLQMQALDLDPLEEERWIAGATLLLRQRRRGRAALLLDEARQVLEGAGQRPSGRLLGLRARV